MLAKVRNHLMSLVVPLTALSTLSEFAVAEATGTLKVFQITQGYNDGPVEAGGSDNGRYFGFDFHNGEMAACWQDDSQIVTSSTPSLVPNFVFGSAHVNSPLDVVVGPNVIISGNLGFRQYEPQLTIDRTNTNNISIIGQNVHSIPHPVTTEANGVLFASSTDSGRNWKTNFPLQKNNFQPDSKIPIPLGLNNSFNRVSYDSHGNLFISYIATFSPSTSTAGTVQFPFNSYLCVSTDHGNSFKVIQRFNPQIFLSSADFFTFPELAVGQNQIAVSMSLLTPGFVVSQGHLFIFPIEGKGEVGPPTHIVLPEGDLYGNGYGSMSFSPTGGLLIVQSDELINSFQSCGLIFTSFLPKGATGFPAGTAFQPFKNVGVGGSAFYPPQPDLGTWSAPKIAYVYNGHHFGRAYMVYLDNSNVTTSSCSYGGNVYSSMAPACPGFPTSSPPCGLFPNWADTNVFVVYSDDDGKTWSTPFAIPKTNTNTRILPQIAIDQTTGNIGVGWLDTVNDPANVKVQVFATVIPWDFFD